MAEVLAVVEGRSEQGFIDTVLAPHLGARGVHITARLVGKVGHKGGVRRPWPTVQREIGNLLRSGGGRRVVYVTTMFDYYGMPTTWPGRAVAPSRPAKERAHSVEQAMHTALREALGADFNASLFLPYVQMHELEALLLTDATKLQFEFVEETDAVAELATSVRGMQPEEVNDSSETAPSKRIIAALPAYERAKVRVAPQVLELIGLPALRSACPHFDSWVTELEALAPAPPAR